MIEGISDDIISDVTTNIIRGPLIAFTQDACNQYGIPITPNVDSGPIWDPFQLTWRSDLVGLPIAKGNKLLLVPKEIVRRNVEYDADKYYRHYIITHLREVELTANSQLVHVLKNGKRKVYKYDLQKKYGKGKDAIVDLTLSTPELLQRYRKDHAKPSQPLTHRELADIADSPPVDWDALYRVATSVKPGGATAHAYQTHVEALLSALFYPVLSNPKFEHDIHEGRKRIDITYTNMGGRGFFEWLGKHYPAGHIFVECKNYGKEVQNPELDQISGRFSPSRGQFGLIVCRKFRNKSLFAKRCKDTAKDHRGYVIALDDRDLERLVAARKKTLDEFFDFPILKERFDALIM
jgi:hypothetical protein